MKLLERACDEHPLRMRRYPFGKANTPAALTAVDTHHNASAARRVVNGIIENEEPGTELRDRDSSVVEHQRDLNFGRVADMTAGRQIHE